MNALRTAILSLGLVALSALPSWAAFPWSSADPLEVTGATPTCTYTTTALACIEKMTANVTSLTLAGMTAGTLYTIIWTQDGTGGRTLTQTPITQATGGLAVPAIPSGANAWTVWTIKATSASAATFVQNYDNSPLWDTWNQAGSGIVATAGTAVANGVTQAQTTLVVPGMTVNDYCQCMAQTLPATWQTGIQLACLPTTNGAACQEINPTAGSITPVAVNLNVRIFP